MKVFKYKILQDNRLILTNYINAETKADAMARLEQEHVECVIHLTEVYGNTMRCEND